MESLDHLGVPDERSFKAEAVSLPFPRGVKPSMLSLRALQETHLAEKRPARRSGATNAKSGCGNYSLKRRVSF
jgi:hypothetical protein